MDTPLGPFWTYDGEALDFVAVEQILRIYEHRQVQIAPGDVVFDVGASMGVFTKVALARGARLVVGFEPEPRAAACYERNFADEIRRGSVQLLRVAAWYRRGSIDFEGAGLGAHVSEEAPGRLTVPTVRIDDVVADLRLDRVDFIKMDIEGAERHALEGASATLARFAPRMAISIYHLADDPQILPELAARAHPGYRTFEDVQRRRAFFY